MEYKRISLFLFLVFGMTMNLVSTTTMLSSLKSTINNLCVELKAILPIVAMLMVVIGAVIYGGGQVMGAETRARANVWATAMIIGAIIGIVISVIMPSILNSIVNGTSITC